ncbi:MAG: uroporphyrinogen decarboxylase [Planctomycetota bacterium]
MAPERLPDLTKTDRFFRVIAGRPVDRPPVWFMRQAGRYLPQYRAVRGNHDFRTVCRTPEIAATLSLQPLDILDVDATIVFNDILIPLEAMGAPFEYGERGPFLLRAVRDSRAVRALRRPDFPADDPVARTIHLLRGEIGKEVPILGFAGAPFTLACYLVEGTITPNLIHAKTMLHREPRTAHALLAKLVAMVTRYLEVQVRAGADAVQVFDTSAGALSRETYREFALPYQREVIAAVKRLGVPVFLYVNDGAAVLDDMAASGADVISVDWRMPLAEVRRRVGSRTVLQGNLDPATLFASPSRVREAVRAMIAPIAGDRRYIVNLGHGILPFTPVESVKAFVQEVHALAGKWNKA